MPVPSFGSPNIPPATLDPLPEPSSARSSPTRIRRGPAVGVLRRCGTRAAERVRSGASSTSLIPRSTVYKIVVLPDDPRTPNRRAQHPDHVLDDQLRLELLKSQDDVGISTSENGSTSTERIAHIEAVRIEGVAL